MEGVHKCSRGTGVSTLELVTEQLRPANSCGRTRPDENSGLHGEREIWVPVFGEGTVSL